MPLYEDGILPDSTGVLRTQQENKKKASLMEIRRYSQEKLLNV